MDAVALPSWAVIAAYFSDKTLVSQQIDSFNEFVNNTMQELVDESQTLILDQNMQHTGRAGDVTVRALSLLGAGALGTTSCSKGGVCVGRVS